VTNRVARKPNAREESLSQALGQPAMPGRMFAAIAALGTDAQRVTDGLY